MQQLVACGQPVQGDHVPFHFTYKQRRVAYEREAPSFCDPVLLIDEDRIEPCQARTVKTKTRR